MTHARTGLRTLDTRFGGCELGVQTLVIGHTGDGKTAFIQNLAEGCARAGGHAGLWIIEDPKRKVADRYLAKELGLSANLLGRLEVPGDVPDRLDAALECMDWARRVHLRVGYRTPDEILDQTRRLADEVDLRMNAVDYAQAFAESEEGLEAVIGRMAQAQNKLAGEIGLAAVFGSQCKTRVIERGRDRWDRNETEDGFRPLKGDAMWSQRAEQYSKAVWTIFRPGRWRKEYGDAAARDDRIEVNVVKQNFGPEGQVVLGWDGKTSRVYDL